MSLNRTAMKQYADTYWWRPCSDGSVWLSSRAINIASELRKRNLSPSDWEAVFLNYDTARYIDGLYLLRKSEVPKLSTRSYYAPNFSANDCILVQDWWGLNDCAHFVSQCLKAGGVGIYDVSVQGLVSKLRAAGDTKTLGYFVTAEAAERILKSDIMKEGDIVAFGASNKTFSHGHSTVYCGGGKVANHSHLNHPSFSGGGGSFGHGVWKPYTEAQTGHPLVILIHFSKEDASLVGSSTLGWWKTTWQGTVYYYYFDKNGFVKYVTGTKPSSLKQGPAVAQGKGYWFESGTSVQICWTATGSYEVYGRATNVTSMSGTCNDMALTLDKMS